MEKIIVEYPTFKIVEPVCEKRCHLDDWSVPTLKNGDTFSMPFNTRSHGTQYKHFQIGSVVGGTVKDGGDPIAALDRARKNGHELHYVFGLGSSITAWKRKQITRIGLEFNYVIRFEGRIFKLASAPNQNVRLIELEKRS